MRLDADVRFAVIPEWVLDADIGPQAVRLYGVLARHADKDNVAFPSRKRLAERMRTTTKSVDRALTELVGIDAVVVIARRQPGKLERMTNEYQLRFAPAQEVGTKTTPRRDTSGEGVGTKTTQGTKATERKPPNETKTLDQSPQTKAAIDRLFADFWAIYPLRKGKRAARLEFERAVKRAERPQMILAGALRYQRDPTRLTDYTAHPRTWLHQDRWLDEEPAAAIDTDEVRRRMGVDRANRG